MELKVTGFVALVFVVVSNCFLNVGAESTYDIHTESESSTKVIKQPAIIIKTPERNYDEPNLNDFESCAQRFDDCKQSCENSYNSPIDCVDKCPKCPILVSQNVMVQGINDTDFRATKQSTINTTNVIKLTNEIHNVIENNLGDITAQNENNVHLHSQNSTVGGKFGYGYTENGPCCMVGRNRVKRQRLCGERCTAPIMHAKPKVICNDETNIDSCRQVIEYFPHRSKPSYASQKNKCQYQQKWPFVSCRNRQQSRYCSPLCMEISYSYILKYGVPLNCIDCFKNLDKSGPNVPPIGYVPPSWVDDSDATGDDTWVLEKSKCRNQDGTISDDCEVGSEEGELTDDQIQDDFLDRDRKFNEAAFGYLHELDMPRNRRNTFRRSKYSKRKTSEDN